MSKTPRSGTTRSTSYDSSVSEEISLEIGYDPVVAEILRSRLYNVATEMATVMIQTSGNPVMSESMDFSTFIADPEGEIIAYSGYLMGHAGSCRMAVEYVIEHQDEENIQPGDQFVVNDPIETGVQQQPDVGIIKPIFYDAESIAWCWAESHMLDVGGIAPGGFAVGAEETYAEAIRLPGIKIVENGEIIEDVKRTIMKNVRIPVRVFNDIRALIAANNRCDERLSSILEEFGSDTFKKYLDVNEKLSEKALRKRISELPDGTFTNTEYVEHDGHENNLYQVSVEMLIDGDEITFDFSGSDDQARGFINAGRGATLGTVFSPIPLLLAPDIPVNEGLFNPLTLEMPEGTIVNPVEPAPVSAGHMETGLTVLSTVHELFVRVMSQSDNEYVRNRVYAPHHETFPATIYSGLNQFGEPDVFLDMHGGGAGGGATSVNDGQDAGAASSSQLNLGIPNVETNESDHPVLYLWRRLHRDSGGPGEHRGGQGVEYAWTLHDADQGQETVTSATTQVPTDAVLGGYPGGTSYFETLQGSNVNDMLAESTLPETFDDLDGEYTELPAKYVGEPITADTVFANHVGGGSGLGDPLERDIEDVASDLRDGYISRQQAENTYGLVIENDEVDAEATRDKRRALWEERMSWNTHRTLNERPESVGTRQSFHHTIDIVNGEYLECSKCSTVFAPYDGADDTEWLEYTSKNRTPITDRFEQLSIYVQERKELPVISLDEYACPNCGVLFQVDVRVGG